MLLYSWWSCKQHFEQLCVQSYDMKKMAIKEIPVIIESIDLVTVISIDIHSWSKLRMIYLWLLIASVQPRSRLNLIYLVICFMPLMTVVNLFNSPCCIKIAFGGWWLLCLRCFFSISKTCIYQRTTLHFDNFIWSLWSFRKSKIESFCFLNIFS